MHTQPVQPLELTYADPGTNREAAVLHRRLVLAAGSLLVFIIGLGIVFSNNDPYYTTPRWITVVVGICTAAALAAVITLLVFIFEGKIRPIVVGLLSSFFLFAAAAAILAASGISQLARIGPQLQRTQAEVALNLAMMLFCLWVPVLAGGAIALAMHRDRMQFILIAAALVSGLIAAGLDALYFLRVRNWYYFYFHWARMLSIGFMLATGLCVAALLTRSMVLRQKRRAIQFQVISPGSNDVARSG